MQQDFSRLKHYYLMKCFSKEEYRDEFNTGKKIYINSMEYFHDLENYFQRYFEGGVFEQLPGTRGYLFISKAGTSIENVMDRYMKKPADAEDGFIETSNFKIYVNGYILCLTIIPKAYISFGHDKITFNETFNIREDFFYLLNEYTTGTGYTYISIYDAEVFMKIFCEAMKKRGYDISYGEVDYQSISQKERIEHYVNRDIEAIIFSKDEKYSYQHEFRIFLQNEFQNAKSHVEEVNINMLPSVVYDMVYLSPSYVEKLRLK